jgi:hypothetical protein
MRVWGSAPGVLSRITAIAVFALLLPRAETAILSLSCDGTATQLMSSEKKVEPISKMSLVVDLSERTVTGFSVPAHIDKSDTVHVEFTGQHRNFSVVGSIDLIGGVVWAIVSAFHPTESGQFHRWDLLCKPMKRV